MRAFFSGKCLIHSSVRQKDFKNVTSWTPILFEKNYFQKAEEKDMKVS